MICLEIKHVNALNIYEKINICQKLIVFFMIFMVQECLIIGHNKQPYITLGSRAFKVRVRQLLVFC